MIDQLRAALSKFYASNSFEGAAECLLQHVLERAVEQTSNLDVQVLRGIVHLRPNDSYQGIATRELGRQTGDHGAQLMPSTTAWRWVEAADEAILLNVYSGEIFSASGASLEHSKVEQRAAFRSRETMMERHATYILALPLRRASSQVDGFVSVELSSKPAHGDLVGWSQVAETLQLFVDVAAPFVGDLPRAPVDHPDSDPGLPVIGAVMRPRIEDLRVFASTDETILLQGETGVGKSMLARWCWQKSPRVDREFVPVKPATEPEAQREGALFGWKRGAFTGAINDRTGLVERAEGGTLFIDEIDKLSRQGQAMLLSLLDDGHYRVLGDSELRQADVRFIVGTNANLEQAVEDGRFLPDLYYRIRVMPVRIPPLRERRDEIVPWAAYMIDGLHRKANGVGSPPLEAGASALLEGQEWPGNLRQLHSVVKRAYAFAVRDSGDGCAVRAVHVERALRYESESSPDALWNALERAAVEFVNHALSRDDGIEIERAGAFTGFVLREAVARVGEREAFKLLGRAKMLDSSNHRKMLKREHEHLKQLAALLELELDSGLI